jgi:putative ABC transport system substrate-binding protein
MNRIERRQFLISGSALLAAPFTTHAQSGGMVYRIGYIQTAHPQEAAHLTKAFEDRLRELGWVEGGNIVIERRFADGKQALLPQLAAQLVALKPDVIVTGANPVVAAVKKATATIPVVMCSSRDPVGSGFIASLARPGGNITGSTNDPTADMVGKNVELLKQAVPSASRAALLTNPLAPAADTYRKVIEAAAQNLGLSIQTVEIRRRDELEAAFAAMAKARIEAVVVHSDPVLFSARIQLVELALKHRLPGVYYFSEYVKIGGLMSYGSNLADNWARAAVFVDKILKGAKPGDLPVEQPSIFRLVINIKTAKALGITIPQTVLLRADEVIE